MSDEPLPMRPFSASLPMALLLARESTMRRFRPLLAEHGLTEQQWRVLRALASADEPIEVSETSSTTTSTTSTAPSTVSHTWLVHSFVCYLELSALEF